MNYIFECADEMGRALNSLNIHWDQAREGWKDESRNHFEREFVYEFNQTSKTYIDQLRRLGDTTQHILNEMP
jgi:uncharacterized protein YukE